MEREEKGRRKNGRVEKRKEGGRRGEGRGKTEEASGRHLKSAWDSHTPYSKYCYNSQAKGTTT